MKSNTKTHSNEIQPKNKILYRILSKIEIGHRKVENVDTEGRECKPRMSQAETRNILRTNDNISWRQWYLKKGFGERELDNDCHKTIEGCIT